MSIFPPDLGKVWLSISIKNYKLPLEMNFGHIFQPLCLVVCFMFFAKLTIGQFGNEKDQSNVV